MALRQLVGQAQLKLGPLVPSAAGAAWDSQVPPVAELLVEGYDGTVYLPTTTERGQIIARVVDLLMQESLNIYFEIDADRLVDVAVPIVGSVRAMIESPSGDVLVVLDDCPTPLEVRATNLDREAIMRTLARALIDPDSDTSRETVAVVTRLPCTEVLFAQVVSIRPEEQSVLSPEPETEFEDHLDAASLGELDRFVVQEAAAACSVNRPTPGCVPHTYVCNFCFLRAHEMCLRLQARGFRPGKLWLYSRSAENRIRVETDLLPNCVTNWLYHVVAVVTSEEHGVRVIDPSLFPTGTISEEEYLRFLDPDPDCVEHTPMAAYRKKCGRHALGVTIAGLDRHRASALAALVATAKEPAGAPPYVRCRIRKV